MGFQVRPPSVVTAAWSVVGRWRESYDPQDELRARAQASNQDATYKLGVIGGIFLPLTFITGLYGMNVEGLWFANRPWAFNAIVGVCAFIAVTVSGYFFRRRWVTN